MEPVSTLLGTAKLLGDLALTLKGNLKEKLEVVMMRLELAKDQVAAMTQERNSLKSENAVLTKENKELQDRLAFHDISDDFERRANGMLYKKDTKEGPFCPKDKVHMLRILHGVFKCPQCGNTGRV